jgi:hypothetical protein
LCHYGPIISSLQIGSSPQTTQKATKAGHQWLTPVILTTQQAESRRLIVKASPGKQFARPYLKKKKKPSQKWAGRVAQGIGPEFKLQYCKKKKRK